MNRKEGKRDISEVHPTVFFMISIFESKQRQMFFFVKLSEVCKSNMIPIMNMKESV